MTKSISNFISKLSGSLLLMLLLLTAISCNKNSDANSDPYQGGNIQGTWGLQMYREVLVNHDNPSLNSDTTLHYISTDWELYFFYADGTYFFHDNNGPKPEERGQYLTTGNQLILQPTTRLPGIGDTVLYNVSGNILTTRYAGPLYGHPIDITITETYSKQ